MKLKSRISIFTHGKGFKSSGRKCPGRVQYQKKSKPIISFILQVFGIKLAWFNLVLIIHSNIVLPRQIVVFLFWDLSRNSLRFKEILGFSHFNTWCLWSIPWWSPMFKSHFSIESSRYGDKMYLLLNINTKAALKVYYTHQPQPFHHWLLSKAGYI